MTDNSQNALWCKNFTLPNNGNFEINILDTSYTLTRLDEKKLKIIQKKDDKETIIHACLDTSSFTYQFRPYFYDLPCMIKLNEELILAPGASANLFLTFPIKAQLVAFKDPPHKGPVVLAEQKKPKLLKSFYGPTPLKHSSPYWWALLPPRCWAKCWIALPGETLTSTAQPCCTR
jgi:hypothetical protein